MPRIEKMIATKSPLYVSVIIDGDKFGATTELMKGFKEGDYIHFQSETKGEFTNIVNIEKIQQPTQAVQKIHDIEEMETALKDTLKMFENNPDFAVFDSTKIALSLFIQRARRQ